MQFSSSNSWINPDIKQSSRKEQKWNYVWQIYTSYVQKIQWFQGELDYCVMKIIHESKCSQIVCLCKKMFANGGESFVSIKISSAITLHCCMPRPKLTSLCFTLMNAAQQTHPFAIMQSCHSSNTEVQNFLLECSDCTEHKK